MIGHLAICMNNKVESFAYQPDRSQPGGAVDGIPIDGFSMVTARGDMVESPGILKAKWTCHCIKIAKKSANELMSLRRAAGRLHHMPMEIRLEM